MTAFIAPFVLVAGLLTGVGSASATAGYTPPAASPGSAVTVHAVTGHKARIPVMTPWHRPSTVWPAAGSATALLAAGSGGHGPSADPTAGSGRAGSGPVWVGPPRSAPAAGAAGVAKARVSVVSQQAATVLGEHGVVFSVARADGAPGAGRVHVSLDYSGFAQAYGGDFGARLALVGLPACALSTPKVAACRVRHPLGSVNDARGLRVGADVTLPAASSGPLVLAAVATAAGSAGNFGAEPVSETDSWVHGDSSGAYTDSYPIAVPPVPGGLEPSVSLGYDSLLTSGHTSSTNNEPSWAGEGWDYTPGYIEEDFTTCANDALEPHTADLCPDGAHWTLSLNGMTTPIVDGGSGLYRAEADAGEKVTRSGNTWSITLPDGTTYEFGANQLPGYTAGDPVTNSQWDVPVWQGCGQAAFCNLPWRLMLDYVVDPHGDAVAYYYNSESNAYAEQDGTTATGTYTRGGVLTKIAYGLRSGNAYATPAAQVTFASSSTRQDAPTDLACTAGAACAVTAPSFWSTDTLTGISTQSLANGAPRNVDAWAMGTTYPATGDTSSAPALWLNSITHTGQDGSSPIALPSTTFADSMEPGRVETGADSAAGYSTLTRPYLTSITNDTGGVTSIAYSPPGSANSLPTPTANTTPVYPDYWTPTGASAPVLDYFNTYAATSITQQDTTGGDPNIVTNLTYAGPAWAYDTDQTSRSATVTWDQWRGYHTVTEETGTAPDPVTEVVDTYLQGLSQDGPQSNPGPVVTLTTSRGQQVTDSVQFAGMLVEHVEYDGAGSGQEVSDAVDLPWTSAATANDPTLDQTAYLTGTNTTLTYTPLAGDGTRQSSTAYTYTSDGLVTSESDVPDTAVPAEDTCTTTTYDANTATWLLDLPETVTTNTGTCASGSSTLVSEDEYSYDGGAAGDVPTAGDLTRTQQASANGLAPTFVTTESATYDEYGRVLTATDADQRTTTMAYTPATGAEPTQTQVTDPMGLATTTSYDPVRDLPLTVTRPAGYQSTKSYDALGRVTAEWTAGNPTSGSAQTTYTYTVSGTAPSVTVEQTEQPGGGYLETETLTDSLGNVRETQSATANGGTDVSDTGYNSDGWRALTSDPYYVTGAPTATLVAAASTSVPSQTEDVYDGAGRAVRQIALALGTETWETDTSYGGNYTTVVPPSGGTSQTTFTDGRGLTSAIYQYHAGVPASPSDPAGDYDQTTYTYTAAKQLAGITDAAGNLWSYTYNLLGQQTSQTDPDAGTTGSVYDSAGQLLSTTDARGKTTSYTYDLDGRKTATYDTTGGAGETTADQTAAWTYDSLAKGLPASSTAYWGGAAYTEQITGYNGQGLPSGESTVIPSAQAALAGTYTRQYSYAADGQMTSYTDSAAGGLPAETVTTGFDTAGEPVSLTGTGTSTYVNGLSYTDLGRPLQYLLGTTAEPTTITDTYDPQTNRVTEQSTRTGTGQASVDDLHYTYDPAGNVTSEADTPGGNAVDVQCFQYDYLARLTQAWAQGATGCASTPSATAEGGAAPYWDTYAYSAVGDLTGITATSPTGTVITTADTYPAAGSARPHAVTASAVTSGSTTTRTTYAYDAAGQLTALASPAQSQSLTWNDAGQLTQDAVTPPGGTAQNTGYVYDADGSLLITTDPGTNTVTLYLGDEELSLFTGNGVVTGTRYYAIGDTTIATRTGAGAVAYVAGDQQGTDTVAIDASTLAVTRRYYDPYGNPRGTAPTTFPTGEKGFIGGTTDTATGLTDLGAREYQPATASFISPDPLLAPYNPQHLNAYTYAYGNPTTYDDPTGACAVFPGHICPTSPARIQQHAAPPPTHTTTTTQPYYSPPGSGGVRYCDPGHGCASRDYWHQHPVKKQPAVKAHTSGSAPARSCVTGSALRFGGTPCTFTPRKSSGIHWRTIGKVVANGLDHVSVSLTGCLRACIGINLQGNDLQFTFGAQGWGTVGSTGIVSSTTSNESAWWTGEVCGAAPWGVCGDFSTVNGTERIKGGGGVAYGAGWFVGAHARVFQFRVPWYLMPFLIGAAFAK